MTRPARSASLLGRVSAAALAAALTLSAPPLAAQQEGLEPGRITGPDALIEASSLIGHRLHILKTTATLEDVEFTELTEAREDWDMAGNVTDIVISRSGEVMALVVDAGGYLGKGAERVISLDDIILAPDMDERGEYFVIYNGRKDAFEKTSEYEEDQVQFRQTDRMMDGETVEIVAIGDLGTDAMLGMAAFGENNNWVGEVSQFTLTGEGKVDKVILDIGGFLGIGETQVSVPLDMIEFRRLGGDEMRAYVSATEEELEEMEPWEEG
jgi:hypothetical protein